MSGSSRAVPVIEIGDVPPCPRCGGEGLLRAQIPNGWANAAGDWVGGHVPVVLCTTCALDDPVAGALITFLHVHGQVIDNNAATFADLTAAWIASLDVTVSDAAFEADIAAWRAGEFDG